MKTHYCEVEKTTIDFENECNWCEEKEDDNMEAKYLSMLGRAVRNVCVDDKDALTHEDVGTIIYQYVQALEKESMRDARDKINGKGE